MHKTIKPAQVDYLPIEKLTVGMITSDGIITSIDYASRTYRVPLGLLELDTGSPVAVLGQVTAEMLDTLVEAIAQQR